MISYVAASRRFDAAVRKARASTKSYLAAMIESAETDAAGKLFGKRLRRENADDEGRNA